MSKRKVKSLMFGSAPDTRVYHNSHKADKNRKPKWKVENSSRKFFIDSVSRARHLKREADRVLKDFNTDPEYRKKVKRMAKDMKFVKLSKR